MSTTIRDRIIQAGDTYTSLSSQLSQLEYAPSTLKQQSDYLADLKTNLAKVKKDLASLRTVTTKERKDHQDLRDSVTRRYAHKLTGRTEKFHSKIEKEEREYLDALHNQQAAEGKEQYLQTTIAETEKQVQELKGAAQRHDELRVQYENLYKDIFEGDTPDFPEEDQMESAVKNAESFFQGAQTKHNANTQALTIMIEADKLCFQAVARAQAALDASTFDMFGGGMMADMMERDNLSRAQAYLSQVQMLLAQATNFQPAIGPFGNVNVASGHMMGDILFDNPFSDYAFREKIKRTCMEIVQLHKRIREETQKQTERVNDATGVLKESQFQLTNARTELERIRRDVFEKVLGQGPPAYETYTAA